MPVVGDDRRPARGGDADRRVRAREAEAARQGRTTLTSLWAASATVGGRRRSASRSSSGARSGRGSGSTSTPRRRSAGFIDPAKFKRNERIKVVAIARSLDGRTASSAVVPFRVRTVAGAGGRRSDGRPLPPYRTAEGPGMAFVAVPGPFDLALTTERFRAFGVDHATVWHEGGLHRVVGGREVRIEAAPGGVDVEPLDAEIEPVVRDAARARLRPRAVLRVGGRRRGARAGDARLARLPADARAGSVRDARRRDHGAAGVALRGGRDPQPLIERFGTQVGHVWAFPSRAALAARERGGARRPSASRAARRSTPSGSRASDLDLDALAALPDDEVKARLVALRGHRRVDGRLVPRPPPRAAARLAVGRPRAAQGGRGSLWWPRRPGGA